MSSSLRTRSTAALVLAAAVVCTGGAWASRRKDPSPARLQCTLLVSRVGPERALSVVVRNNGGVPAVLRYYYPAMLGGFVATVDGARVSVHQPAIDMPVRPEQRAVAPGAEVTIPLVIRLRFAPQPGAPRDGDPFRWTLEHAPARVALEATFGGAPGAVPCRGVLEP